MIAMSATRSLETRQVRGAAWDNRLMGRAVASRRCFCSGGSSWRDTGDVTYRCNRLGKWFSYFNGASKLAQQWPLMPRRRPFGRSCSCDEPVRPMEICSAVRPRSTACMCVAR